MTVTNELLDLALQLPPEERARMARQLLLSLEPEQADGDHEETWRREIQDRMERLDRGETSTSDWREALGRIRQAMSARQQP
jgi:putative addiction module component (TIGR02574 family)